LFFLLLASALHSWHHIRALHRSGSPAPRTAYFHQPVNVGVLILLAYGIVFGQIHLPGIFFVGIFWSLLAGLIQFVFLIISIELSSTDRDAI
jgi:tellurite resistance protein TehA-like permease